MAKKVAKVAKRRATTKSRNRAKSGTGTKLETTRITCAYCEGEGLDPFGSLSILSKCQVCGGRGKVSVFEPYIKCAFCNGTGVYPDKRITCTACNGKGVVNAVENPQTCPSCDGTGESKSTPGLWCVTCKGKGVIRTRAA